MADKLKMVRWLALEPTMHRSRLVDPNHNDEKRRMITLPEGEEPHPSVKQFFRKLDDDEVEVTENLAAPEAPVAMSAARPKVKTGRERITLIKEAISKFSEDDYTSTGLPKVSAIENAVGFGISGDERDQAWHEIEQE